MLIFTRLMLFSALFVSVPLYAAGVVDAVVGKVEYLAGPMPVYSGQRGKVVNSPKSGEAKLSLQQCIAIALGGNLELAGKVVALEGIKATETATFRKMLPTISLSGSRSDILSNSNSTSGGSLAESYSTTVTLAQPIYRGNSLWGGWKKAELASQQAQMDVSRQAQQLVSDVKSAFYGVLEKERLLQAASEALERLKIHEKNARAYFNVGRYWQNEVLQAQVEVARGEQEVIAARNDLLLAKSTINRLMRRPLDHPIVADGLLEWRAMDEWSLENAYQQARVAREDLKKSYLDLESSKLNEQTVGSTRMPQVDFNTAYNVTASQLDHRDSETTTTATISMTWKAWNWGQTDKEVVAAKATSRQKQLSYDDKVQGVLLEVREAFLNAQEASQKVKVLEKALEQAEENLKVNEIRYQQQLGSATEVLEAMDLRSSTRNSHISSLSSYLTALAKLDLAVGKRVEIEPIK